MLEHSWHKEDGILGWIGGGGIWEQSKDAEQECNVGTHMAGGGG